MKKNLIRIMAFALVLVLALGIIPLAALAETIGSADPTDPPESPASPAPQDRVYVDGIGFEKKNPTYGSEGFWLGFGEVLRPGDKLKAEDYDKLIETDGDLYDFKGFGNFEKLNDKINDWIDDRIESGKGWTDKEFNAMVKKYVKDTKIPFDSSDIKIPKFPTNPKKQAEWLNKYGYIIAGYVPHTHNLSRWYSDSTTHWRECLSCKKYLGIFDQFMNQNWHSDGDEDRICDVCGADIPYHEVSVIDSKGGKITVNLDEAPHRRKITATVEVEEGYKLKKLHFTKVRTDGSKQEITRYKKNGEFYTLMPTYDLEVTAEYVKKN